ncbi:hypothetical protein [Muriicola soli]|uniref:Uncharacterized protein n=1 Tax=Muriicola soli TaxID=2507538 RepID=A0A411E688_9FLAO|nr:hypothetical protein [Muriicola soli]QBA63191.1 hypothetical protein EQY75_00640 [Muriicola soli]
MGWFDSESAEDKMYKALEGFEVHTSDVTVNRKIRETEFFQQVSINTFDGIRDLAKHYKLNGFHGIVGLRMTPGFGLGGANGVIIYGTAVKFE